MAKESAFKEEPKRWLKNKKTGVWFPYTEALARNEDMDEIGRVNEARAVATLSRTKKDKKVDLETQYEGMKPNASTDEDG